MKRECSVTLDIAFIRRLALYFIFSLCAWSAMAADTTGMSRQERLFDLELKNATAVQAFRQVESATGLKFNFFEGDIDPSLRITRSYRKASLEFILDDLSQQLHLLFKQVNKSVNVKKLGGKPRAASASAKQTSFRVRGVVTAEDLKAPLPGVTVQEKNTGKGGVTDEHGAYSIEVTDGNAVLLFSFTGYSRKEVAVGGRGTVNVTMEVNSESLKEVVITALGITREARSLGYSVSEVKGKDISEAGQMNVINGLTGKVAGLQINMSGMSVDGKNRVILRGATSLSNDNQPLIVVDGIPLQGSSPTPVSTIPPSGGIANWGSPIGDINPQDVESISVLKGASATALYGSRASNGVLLITTKMGSRESGKLSVNVTSNYTWRTPLIYPAYQRQYGQGYNGEYEYVDGEGNGKFDDYTDSWGPALNGQMIAQWDPSSDQPVVKPFTYHDNFRNFLQSGMVGNNTVSFMSHSEFTNTRLSFSHQKQRGIIPTTGLERISVNLNTLTKMGKKLSLHLRGNLSSMESPNRTSSGGWGRGNVISRFFDIPANIDIRDLRNYKDENGDKKSFTFWGANPYWDLYEDKSPSERNRFSAAVTLKYDISEKFWIEGTALNNQTRTDYEEWNAMSMKHNNLGGYSEGSAYENEYNLEVRGGYKQRFGKLDLNVIAGAVKRQNVYRNNDSWTNGGLIKRNVYNLENSIKPIGHNSWYGKKQVQSVFGVASLGYKDMLYVDVTARNDWSSTLPKNAWSYIYPSASASWIFTETFRIPKSVVSFGKLRASVAQVGNDTEPYALNLYIDRVGNSWGDLPVQQVGSTLPPAGLKPEITSAKEAGLNMVFFDNRIDLDVAYYHTNTRNQIVNIDAPWERGFSTAVVNVGDLENKGIEIALNASPIRSERFSWDLGLTFSRNWSNLKELYKDLTHQRIGEFFGTETRAVVGDRYGSIWGFNYFYDDAAYYQLNKDMASHGIQEKDLHGTGKVLISDDGWPLHHVWEGIYPIPGYYVTPDWMGGITTTFRYGNFSLTALVDGRFGGKVVSTTHMLARRVGLAPESVGFNANGVDIREPVANGGGILFDGTVLSTGEPNTVYIGAQDFYGNANGQVTPAFTFDATNIKLRELRLSYAFSKDLVKRAGLKGASISLVGNNLLLIRNHIPGIDSETGSMGADNSGQGMEFGSEPTQRAFGFQVSVDL